MREELGTWTPGAAEGSIARLSGRRKTADLTTQWQHKCQQPTTKAKNAGSQEEDIEVRPVPGVHGYCRLGQAAVRISRERRRRSPGQGVQPACDAQKSNRSMPRHDVPGRVHDRAAVGVRLSGEGATSRQVIRRTELTVLDFQCVKPRRYFPNSRNVTRRSDLEIRKSTCPPSLFRGK